MAVRRNQQLMTGTRLDCGWQCCLLTFAHFDEGFLGSLSVVRVPVRVQLLGLPARRHTPHEGQVRQLQPVHQWPGGLWTAIKTSACADRAPGRIERRHANRNRVAWDTKLPPCKCLGPYWRPFFFTSAWKVIPFRHACGSAVASLDCKVYLGTAGCCNATHASPPP